jgi:hypothetical protein
VPTPNLTENDEDRPPVAAIRREGDRRKRALATSAAALLVVGGLATWGLWPSAKPTPAAPCPACVTGGVPAFDPSSQPMQTLQAAMARENTRVRQDGRPYVTIALLSPFTTGLLSDVSPSRMLDLLRGAYVAQTAMNDSGILGVQLILANEGTGTELTAGQAVRQLETLEGPPERLVAVAGLGLSISATRSAAQTLAGNGMPMFGAVTTADELNSSLVNGLPGAHVLIQVVPSVGEQVNRLSAVIGRPAKAVLVVDQQATDLYTGDLEKDYGRVFGASLGSRQSLPYTPGPDTSAEFGVIADTVCYQPGAIPDVLYAGRASVLASLVKNLQDDENCANKKVTVVTASDGDGLTAGATKSIAGDGRVSVIYSDIVNVSDLKRAFKNFYATTLATVGGPAGGLDDPWTIGAYNSMMAAWTSIKAAYDSQTPPVVPATAGVQQFAELLIGSHRVPGATGLFSLTTDGQLESPDIPVVKDAAGNQHLLAP